MTVLERPEIHRHVLTTVEFDVLWEGLGLGPTPVILRLASPGRTHAERRAVQAAGWQAMRDRGLAGPSGPDPELTRLLHLLARPTEQLELRAWWDRDIRAVAAARAEAGALALRQDETVTLSACGTLPSGMLGLLPPAPPGPGRSCTVPARALSSGPATDVRATLVARGIPAGEAGLLTRMLAGAGRRAQVVALAADRWGVLRRSGGVLTVLDGPHGRYLLTRSTGEDGVEWITIAPTDERQLRHRFTELLSVAVGSAARP
jgi:EspG family